MRPRLRGVTYGGHNAPPRSTHRLRLRALARRTARVRLYRALYLVTACGWVRTALPLHWTHHINTCVPRTFSYCRFAVPPLPPHVPGSFVILRFTTPAHLHYTWFCATTSSPLHCHLPPLALTCTLPPLSRTVLTLPHLTRSTVLTHTRAAITPALSCTLPRLHFAVARAHALSFLHYTLCTRAAVPSACTHILHYAVGSLEFYAIRVLHFVHVAGYACLHRTLLLYLAAAQTTHSHGLLIVRCALFCTLLTLYLSHCLPLTAHISQHTTFTASTVT